jgi:methylated-DNA-[protein]-cysteine S-methyltransferase
MDTMKDLNRVLKSTAPKLPLPDDSLDRFLQRAERAELDDVTYEVADSPLGPLLVALTRRGLTRLNYPDAPIEVLLEELAEEVSPRIIRGTKRSDDVRRQLDEYFSGKRTDFDVPIDWRFARGFAGRVLRTTAKIPFGRVSTYTQVATKAGSPRAYRAAGNALGSNPMPIIVPCHRVLHTSGGLGGYTGGLHRKEFLLRLEGVITDEK